MSNILNQLLKLISSISVCGKKKKFTFFSTFDLVVKFISDGKKERTGAMGCRVNCFEDVTTTTTTTTTDAHQNCTMKMYKTVLYKVNNLSDCEEKCKNADGCKYLHYNAKVSILSFIKLTSSSDRLKVVWCLPVCNHEI